MAMEYLLIGVGGTGARVLEAFTYLSAAGVLGEEIPKVHLRMVDMDTENGNLLRLGKALESYTGSYNQLFEPVREHGWHAREIAYETKDSLFTWKIGCDADKELDGKFRQNKENLRLLNGLYGIEELYLPLNVGCRGRPRIGALEIVKRFNDDSRAGINSFWGQLFSGDLQAAIGRGELRVMLVGSAFGGSGASGVPNLAKLIKQNYCVGNNSVGITLMAPFYHFNDKEVEAESGAKSAEFMINTKAALLYYAQSNILDDLHAMYIVGGKLRGMKDVGANLAKTSVGSQDQCDPAMPELLVAALSALDFFREDAAVLNNQDMRVVVADTSVDALNDWKAYPYEDELKTGIRRLQRMALLWRHIKLTAIGKDRGAWKSLHDRYGKSNHFDANEFLQDTRTLREFLCGEEYSEMQGLPSQNVGALGFLKELGANGLDDERTAVGALNINKEIEYMDRAVGLDSEDAVSKTVSGMTIYDLAKKLKSPSGRTVFADAKSRRTTFVATASKACL